MRYARTVLLLAASGALTAAVAGVLSPVVALVAGTALLCGLRGGRATLWVGNVAAVVVALGIGFTPADQPERPPQFVASLLLVLVLVLGVPGRSREHLDASAVAAVGVVVVSASAAVGRGIALPLLLDVALLVVMLAFRQHAVRRHVPRRPQGFPGRVLAVALGVGGLLLLAAPAPSSTGFHRSLFHRSSGSGADAVATVSPDTFADDTLDLGVRGRLSQDPVMSVSADAPELWRGGVYATYDGTAWRKPGTAAAQAIPAPAVTAQGASLVTVPASTVDPHPGGASVRVVVRPDDAQVTAYAPGVITAVVSPSTLVRGPAGSYGFRPAAGAYALDVQLPVTGATDPAGADPAGWTQLPTSLPQRVRDLAASLRGPTRAATVAAVETYLRAHERYTLDAPVPRRGHDAVDEFLFHTHRGFCEQFASAEVVLLRADGIPARLATGFAYGTVDGTGTRSFTAADAHAWVEVSYGRLGWASSDPTAGSQILPANQGLLARIHGWFASLAHSPIRRAVTAGVLAALVLVAVGLRLLGRRSVRHRRARAALPPVSAAFARLERRFPREPASTPREYAATLPDGLEEAVAVWEQELYAPTAPSPEEVRHAVTTVSAAVAATDRPNRRRPPTAPICLLVLGFLLVPAHHGDRLRPQAYVPGCDQTCVARTATVPIVGPPSFVADFGGSRTVETYSLPRPTGTTVDVASRTPGPSTFGSIHATGVVRGHPAAYAYDPTTGQHVVRWTEAGREMSVDLPVDVVGTPDLSGWRVYGPGSPAAAPAAR